MSQKRVYLFGNGKAEGNAKMREELGGKGANLAEMNLIGHPHRRPYPVALLRGLRGCHGFAQHTAHVGLLPCGHQ